MLVYQRVPIVCVRIDLLWNIWKAMGRSPKILVFDIISSQLEFSENRVPESPMTEYNLSLLLPSGKHTKNYGKSQF